MPDLEQERLDLDAADRHLAEIGGPALRVLGVEHFDGLRGLTQTVSLRLPFHNHLDRRFRRGFCA